LGNLRAQTPESKVLVLTMHDDGGYLRQVMASGAAGYVLKQAAGKELLAAIRVVFQGGVYLHPSHAQLLMSNSPEPSSREQVQASNPAGERFRLLSDREAELLKLVALGYRNQEIASELCLSVKTVETYKSRMMQKLGIKSRIGLVRYAMELGLLDHKD
jgi:two-component system, NarL family, response regulator NreC